MSQKKQEVLCVNLFCDCGEAYEDFPTRAAALRMRKINPGCSHCKKDAYTWAIYYRLFDIE